MGRNKTIEEVKTKAYKKSIFFVLVGGRRAQNVEWGSSRAKSSHEKNDFHSLSLYLSLLLSYPSSPDSVSISLSFSPTHLLESHDEPTFDSFPISLTHLGLAATEGLA